MSYANGTWTIPGSDQTTMPGVVVGQQGWDNGAVINAYMNNQMPNGGDTPALPAGNIYCQTPIVIPQGVTLVGSGRQESNTQQGTYILAASTFNGGPTLCLVSLPNTQSGFRNLTVNAASHALYCVQVSAAGCGLSEFTALGGTVTTLDTAYGGTNIVSGTLPGTITTTSNSTLTVASGNGVKFNTAASVSVPQTFYVDGVAVTYTSATSYTASGCNVAAGQTATTVTPNTGDTVSNLVSTAGSLRMLNFEINTNANYLYTAVNVINWQGSDGLAAHGRMINGAKILGAGGTMLVDIHFTAGSGAAGTSNIIDQGGNEFVGCYFDSIAGGTLGNFASASPATITTTSNGTVTLNGTTPATQNSLLPGGGVIVINGIPYTYASASGLVASGVNLQPGWGGTQTPTAGQAVTQAPANGLIDRTQANVPSTYAGCRYYNHAGAQYYGATTGVPVFTETSTADAGAVVTGGSLLIDGKNSSFSYFIKAAIASTKVSAIDIPLTNVAGGGNTPYISIGFTDITPPLGQFDACTIGGVPVALGGSVPGSNRPPQIKPIYAPANPASTTSTAAVMAGLGTTAAYTPTSTGKLNVRIEGQAATATAAAGVTIQGYHGTGAAPANGAAATGTTFGPAVTAKGTGAAATAQFCVVGQITGQTLGTPVWIDVSFLTANTSDAASLTGITVTVEEVS